MTAEIARALVGAIPFPAVAARGHLTKGRQSPGGVYGLRRSIFFLKSGQNSEPILASRSNPI
jgi:hypothetical protein